MAPQPDPDARQYATGGAAGPENDHRPPPYGGELLLVSGWRDDPYASAPAAAVSSSGGGESCGDGSTRGRRLRLAPSVQLELVSVGDGPGPEVVWASLPQRSRETVLGLLARLIDTGAVEEVTG